MRWLEFWWSAEELENINKREMINEEQ